MSKINNSDTQPSQSEQAVSVTENQPAQNYHNFDPINGFLRNIVIGISTGPLTEGKNNQSLWTNDDSLKKISIELGLLQRNYSDGNLDSKAVKENILEILSTINNPKYEQVHDIMISHTTAHILIETQARNSVGDYQNLTDDYLHQSREYYDGVVHLINENLLVTKKSRSIIENGYKFLEKQLQEASTEMSLISTDQLEEPIFSPDELVQLGINPDTLLSDMLNEIYSYTDTSDEAKISPTLRKVEQMADSLIKQATLSLNNLRQTNNLELYDKTKVKFLFLLGNMENLGEFTSPDEKNLASQMIKNTGMQIYYLA